MTSTSKENSNKMNLAGYYHNLPEATHPKTEFVKKIASDCGVETATVRLWIKGVTKPSNPKHQEYLAKLTGISKDQLFE